MELLVAQLETIFAGPGFRVQSPENIRSRVSDNIVKVDVTVRGRVGAQDVLIAFECRDRKDNQGVDWIQQLVTRKRDIGASELIAVSRDGFSVDAKREANAHGIPLRTMSSLGQEELASLVLGAELEIQRPRYQARQLGGVKYHKFGLDPYAADSWPDLTPEFLERVLAAPYEPSFRDKEERKPVSVAEMIHMADWDSAFEDGVFEGTRHHCAALATEYVDSWGCESMRFELWLDDDAGIKIGELVFRGDVWWEIESVPLSTVMEYRHDERALATVAEFDLRPHGIDQTLQLFLDGELTVLTESPVEPADRADNTPRAE